MREDLEYRPGQVIPGSDYRVVRVLGVGGMGAVYEVENSLPRRFVLKTLRASLADRADLLARFQREARTIARLSHPNIIEVFDFRVTSDERKLPYYVMERLDGQTLRAVTVARRKLGVARACTIAIDVCDALDHAHEHGVIHRDVKPENIFLHREENGVVVVKLLDFGVAKLGRGGAAEHTGSRFVGTYRYASPEQLRGEPALPESDLYSMAVVLFEMIAGRHPFGELRSERRFGEAHLHVTPPPLSRFEVVPRRLEGLVASGLAKDPLQRPRDAFYFASALREIKRELLRERGGDTQRRRTVSCVLAGAAQTAAPEVTERGEERDDAPTVADPIRPRPASTESLACPTTRTSPLEPEPKTLVVPAPPAQSKKDVARGLSIALALVAMGAIAASVVVAARARSGRAVDGARAATLAPASVAEVAEEPLRATAAWPPAPPMVAGETPPPPPAATHSLAPTVKPLRLPGAGF